MSDIEGIQEIVPYSADHNFTQILEDGESVQIRRIRRHQDQGHGTHRHRQPDLPERGAGENCRRKSAVADHAHRLVSGPVTAAESEGCVAGIGRTSDSCGSGSSRRSSCATFRKEAKKAAGETARTLTVGSILQSRRNGCVQVPMIRLVGRWLSKAGFQCGEQLVLRITECPNRHTEGFPSWELVITRSRKTIRESVSP